MDQKDVNEEIKCIINGLMIASMDLKSVELTPIEVYTNIHKLFKKGLRIISPLVHDSEFQRIFEKLFSDETNDSDIDSTEDFDWSPLKVIVPSSKLSSPLKLEDFSSYGFLCNNDLINSNYVNKASDSESCSSIPLLKEKVSETDLDDDEYDDDYTSNAGSLTYYGDISIANETIVSNKGRKRYHKFEDEYEKSQIKRPRYCDLLSSPITPVKNLFGTSTPIAIPRKVKECIFDDIEIPLICSEYSSDALTKGYFPMNFSPNKPLFGQSCYEKKENGRENSIRIYKTHNDLFNELFK